MVATNAADHAWSPDGARLAFRRNRGIWVKNLGTGDETQITAPELITDIGDENPDWSSDGLTIVFERAQSPSIGNGAYQSDVYTVPAAGGTAVRRTNAYGLDADPVFSPDGMSIAFSSRRDSGDGFRHDDIWIMSATGTDQRRVTDHTNVASEAPTWAPRAASRKVQLVFEPNLATLPGLELFQVAADGFSEVRAVATVTDRAGIPLSGEPLVFLPDPTGEPPIVLCTRAIGRLWPDTLLDDGTPIPAEFTEATETDARVKMRVRAGTRAGSWELVALTPDAIGGDDLEQTSLELLGAAGTDVPDALLDELRLQLDDPTGARPVTAGDPNLVAADVQEGLLEWLIVLKQRGRALLGQVEFAPIHVDGVVQDFAAIVFYPRGADPAPLLAHFASDGATGIPYETRVLDIGLAQLLTGGGDLPNDMPTLPDWESADLNPHGIAAPGRLRPHPDERLQFFGYPYPLPLAEPVMLPLRAGDDTQCFRPNPNLVAAGVQSPVSLLFTDGQGRRLGVDAAGDEHLEVPGGVLSYNDAGEPAGYVVPAGPYTVTLAGTGKGGALVTFLAPDDDASAITAFELTAKPGVAGTLDVTADGPAQTLVFGGKNVMGVPFGFTKRAHKCTAGKKKCVAKLVTGLFACRAKATKSGTVDASCAADAVAKFSGGATPAKGCFAKLEAKGGCLTVGDAADLAAQTEAVVDATAAALDDAFPAATRSACAASKLGCAAKRNGALFACHVKAESKGALDPTCVAKAVGAFDGKGDAARACFAKAEKKGGCLTSGDTAAEAARSDSAVDDLVCALDPVRQLVPCD